MQYELYYWPTIQGRGEFVRLALVEAAAEYVDVARTGDGERRMSALLEDGVYPFVPFAPPFLKIGKRIIGQTANILLYLGDSYGLAPRNDAGRSWTHQLQLTLADFVTEAHDTHHPIAAGLYYKEQRHAAKRRAADFVANRLPKFLGYFEHVITRNPSGPYYLVGAKLSYADLSLFQVIAGLNYAFPKAMSRLASQWPEAIALHARVAKRPRIAAYLASDRRLPFNQQGIFRHYAELDR